MVFYRLRSGAPMPERPAKRYRPTKSTVAQQLVQLKRKVQRFTPETKRVNISQSAANVTVAAGAIIFVSGVAQGVDSSDRLGSKVHAHMLELNVAITSAAVAATSNLNYAAYLVKDSMSAGALPTISGAGGIFQAFNPIAGLVQPIVRDRFKVLRQWDINASSLFAGSQSSLMKWRVPLTGLTEYITTVNNVNSAQKNAYYVVFLSNDIADTVDFSVNGFFHFTDA